MIRRFNTSYVGSGFLATASKDRKIRLATVLLLSAEIASKVLNGVASDGDDVAS